jgi:hypothetical protein
MNTEKSSLEAENQPSCSGAVKRSCLIVQYGEEERLCKKCGYILWEKKGKSNDEIIDNMAKAGYDAPKCRDNFA